MSGNDNDMPETFGMYRGHKMTLVKGAWLYADNETPVSENPNRPCGFCGLPNTPEGHDGCLGAIKGAANACCGHGHDRGYIQW